MPVASSKQSRMLSASVWTPDIDPSAGTYTPEGALIADNLAFSWDSYSHLFNTQNGHDSFQITLSVRQDDVDDWFENGLNRHIQIYDNAQNKIIAGFVNKLTINSAFLAASRGPVMDIANRVSVIYTPQDVSVYPPVNGATTVTTIAEDSDSQSRHGILEAVVSGGTVLDDGTTDWATKIRDVYLEENKDASTSEKAVNLPGESNPTVSLEILGYAHYLTRFVYNSTTTGTVAASTKLQSVLGGDPNGIFSTDYSGVESNTFLMPAMETKDRLADTIIKEIVGLGNGADDSRRIFGVFTDQKVKYYALPTTIEYQLSLRDGAQQVRNYPDGAVVEPWNVEAGKWLFITDFLIGRVPPSTSLRQDPRALFIESVSFSTPYGVSINGVKLTDLPQLLSKVGLGLI